MRSSVNNQDDDIANIYSRSVLLFVSYTIWKQATFTAKWNPVDGRNCEVRSVNNFLSSDEKRRGWSVATTNDIVNKGDAFIYGQTVVFQFRIMCSKVEFLEDSFIKCFENNYSFRSQQGFSERAWCVSIIYNAMTVKEMSERTAPVMRLWFITTYPSRSRHQRPVSQPASEQLHAFDDSN